jgi:hypothetical protein
VTIVRLAMSSLLVILVANTAGCIVAHDRGDRGDRGYREGYKEGYYDREHHRYWHEKAWRDCVEHDEHCRD